MTHHILAMSEHHGLIVENGAGARPALPCVVANGFVELRTKLAGVLGVPECCLRLLRLLVRDRSPLACWLVELEVDLEDRPLAHGYSCIPVAVAGSVCIDEERFSAPLARRFAEDTTYKQTMLAPWERPGWRGDAKRWIQCAVPGFRSSTFADVPRKLGSPWNYVASFSVDASSVPCYFKAVRS